MVVDRKVQKEKQMFEDVLKSKLGMAKWSKRYEAKLKAGGVFEQNKESVLNVALATIHPAVIQQMKSIKEYEEIEKKKDLVGTLRINLVLNQIESEIKSVTFFLWHVLLVLKNYVQNLTITRLLNLPVENLLHIYVSSFGYPRTCSTMASAKSSLADWSFN